MLEEDENKKLLGNDVKRQNRDEREEEDPEDGGCCFAQFFSAFGKGSLIVVLSSVSAAVSAILIKNLHQVDPFILSFVRELLTLPCLSFYLWHYSVPFVDGKFCLLTWRGAAITLYMTALYFGCRYLPLGDVRTLNSTQAVFVNLLACLCLGEPCGARETQILIVAMIGVIMVMEPPFLFSGVGGAGGGVRPHHMGTVVHDARYYAFACFVLVGTASLAVSLVISRYVSHIDPFAQTIYSSVLSLVSGLLGSLIRGTFNLQVIFDHFFLIFMAGFLSFLTGVLLIVALQRELASTVAIVKVVTDIVLAYLAQITLYDQVPGTMPIMGVLLITTTVVMEEWRKKTKEEKGDGEGSSEVVGNGLSGKDVP